MFIIFAILYIPRIFITKEGQKCIVDTNCSRLGSICDEMNEDIKENELGHVGPMCIDWVCTCEWYGNLLKLNK